MRGRTKQSNALTSRGLKKEGSKIETCEKWYHSGKAKTIWQEDRHEVLLERNSTF